MVSEMQIFKQGTFPQRVLKATEWIKREIERAYRQAARDPRYMDNAEFFKGQRVRPLESLRELLHDMNKALSEHQKPVTDVYALEAQIKCVRRELALRKNVYSKRVKQGKMTPDEARREYDLMQGVLETLEGLQ